MLPDDELSALADSIQKIGQLEPITLHEGKILDGRNRYAACLQNGIEPKYTKYTGTDPIGYVIAVNELRRHMSESQRAMVASKLANMTQGARTDLASIEATSQDEAGDLLHVTRSSVQRASKVRATGAKELIEAAEQGLITVSLAASIADAPIDVQQAVVEKVNAGTKPVEAVRQTRKENMRKVQIPEGKYRVIYTDPPWKYGDTRGGLDGYSAAEDHYPAMSLKELCELPIKDLAIDDAVLFMWTTSPLLEDSFKVINSRTRFLA